MTKKTTINKIVSSKAFWIIISLLASFLLWTYIMSTEETTIEMTFSNVKVVYQGADDLRATRGLIVTGADADTVSVRLKGTRRVLGNLSSADLSAVIDVSGISQAREMQVSYSLQYPTNVDKSSITVLSKSPETISFSVVQEANKTLEVKGVFTGSVKDGYTAEPIQVDPSSITLYGPQEELDAVDSICVYVTRTDLDKSIAPTNCPYVLLDKDGNELSLSQYVTSSADSVRVTIPILQYKDIKLNATLISGGGATSEDAEVTIEPSTLRVTGNTAVLDAMADELTIRTIDLAQITGTETFEVTPELPSGVTSRADSQTVKITVTLKGLVTKEFTVPTANILRKEAPTGMTFADQNVKITVRGRASVMSSLRMEDLTVTADFSRHYDAAAKQVELEVALPANVSAGAIGGPYTVQVSLSETDGGNTES